MQVQNDGKTDLGKSLASFTMNFGDCLIILPFRGVSGGKKGINSWNNIHTVNQ